MSTKPYRPIGAAEGDFLLRRSAGTALSRTGVGLSSLTMVHARTIRAIPKNGYLMRTEQSTMHGARGDASYVGKIRSRKVTT